MLEPGEINEDHVSCPLCEGACTWMGRGLWWCEECEDLWTANQLGEPPAPKVVIEDAGEQLEPILAAHEPQQVSLEGAPAERASCPGCQGECQAVGEWVWTCESCLQPWTITEMLESREEGQ